jgi:hypothetical protein
MKDQGMKDHVADHRDMKNQGIKDHVADHRDMKDQGMTYHAADHQDMTDRWMKSHAGNHTDMRDQGVDTGLEIEKEVKAEKGRDLGYQQRNLKNKEVSLLGYS